MPEQTSQTLAAVAASSAIRASGYNLVIVQIPSGTFVGANLIFEASIDSTNGTDGTWINVNAVRSNANVVENNTGVLGAAPAYAWEISCAAYTWFRVRVTALTSGAVPVSILADTTPIEMAPAVQTHAVTGSSATLGATVTPAVSSVNVINVNTAASTNASSQKAAAGSLTEISVSNPTATAASVKFYNKATAPTVGTDVPILTITVPAGGLVMQEFGVFGKRFTTGIAMAVTALPADSDTGVAVAGVHVHGTYI